MVEAHPVPTFPHVEKHFTASETVRTSSSCHLLWPQGCLLRVTGTNVIVTARHRSCVVDPFRMDRYGSDRNHPEILDAPVPIRGECALAKCLTCLSL
jgi:hypothetical protein